MTKRRPLTRREFASLIISQDGKCAKCAGRLVADQIVDEHIVPLFSGGGNEIGNRALYCYGCAGKKTRGEAPGRAKTRRHERGKTQADKRASAKERGTHKAIPTRGFQGSRNFKGEVKWK